MTIRRAEMKHAAKVQPGSGLWKRVWEHAREGMMKRRSVLKVAAGLAAAAAIGLPATPSLAQGGKTYTVALIPGLTTDAFLITMNKGA